MITLMMLMMLMMMAVCVCAVCRLMSSGVFAMFVTHSVSSLATVRSYSSTFQMPVLLSRVAVNTTRASLSSAAAPSLYAALTTSTTAAAAAAVPGTQIDVHLALSRL